MAYLIMFKQCGHKILVFDCTRTITIFLFEKSYKKRPLNSGISIFLALWNKFYPPNSAYIYDVI